MAKKHAPSLLFSVTVHLLAGFIFYTTYQAVTSITKHKKQETLICMSLNTYQPQVIKKEVIKKKIIKKVLKKKKKTQKKKIENIKHKIPKKTVMIKKPIKEIKTIVPQIFTPTIKTTHKETQEIQQIKEIAKKQVNEFVPTVELNTSSQTPKISQQKEYLNNHLHKIEKLLQDNLYYPRRARKRGIIGTVIVHFEINTNGEVTQAESLSSTSKILSRAALRTIEDLSGQFPKPTEKLFLKIPIVYKLHDK